MAAIFRIGLLSGPILPLPHFPQLKAASTLCTNVCIDRVPFPVKWNFASVKALLHLSNWCINISKYICGFSAGSPSFCESLITLNTCVRCYSGILRHIPEVILQYIDVGTPLLYEAFATSNYHKCTVFLRCILVGALQSYFSFWSLSHICHRCKASIIFV